MDETEKIEIKDDESCHGFTLLDIIGIVFILVLLFTFAR